MDYKYILTRSLIIVEYFHDCFPALLEIWFRMIEEMYIMGYDPVISSDLVDTIETSTIFFRKVSSRRKDY